MDLRYDDTTLPPRDALVSLYRSVGWTGYADKPDDLERALAGSTWVQAVWDGDELVGLVRVLSDGVSILYVQDLLVRPSHQRRGLARALVTAVLERYAHVRQKVLLTDDSPAQRAFYEALGFRNTRDLEKHRLNAYVRFEGVALE